MINASVYAYGPQFSAEKFFKFCMAFC